MGGKWMRYNSWTERNEFWYVKQQHVTTMQRLWQSFEVEQAAWIKSRAPETNLHEKKSEDHHMLPIIEEKNGKDEEQYKAEHSDATPSILEVDDKPVEQLDTPEPSPVKNEKRKGSTNVKKDMLRASPKPTSSRQGSKATKKSNTSEICKAEASVEQRLAVQERIQQGFYASDDLGARHRDRRPAYGRVGLHVKRALRRPVTRVRQAGGSVNMHGSPELLMQDALALDDIAAAQTAGRRQLGGRDR